MNRKWLCPFVSLLFVVLPAIAAHASEAAAPHWTYEGEHGPSHWGSLNKEYAACSSGKSQSPIDLAHALSKDLPNLDFHYQPSKINIINNGHTIQVNYEAGSYIVLDGVRYDLQQFHFHVPSEHTVNGKHSDAEVHLVHKNADGKLAVVGILINTGAENPAFQSTWNHLPAAEGPAQQFTDQVNISGILPAVRETYRYDGSLTTPPCTEGVKWLVMVNPIEVSKSQLDALTQILHKDNRPIQALNNRTITEDSTP